MAHTTASQTPGPGKIRHYAVTPPSWSPPSSATIRPPQPTPPETADEPTRDTEMPPTGVLLPAQNEGDADQHHCEEDDRLHEVPVAKTILVDDPEARPVRKKKPNMRNHANVFDLSSVGTKRRRTPRGAK